MSMLKDRKDLETKLMLFLKNVDNVRQRQGWYVELSDTYDIPIDLSSDIISLRKDLSEYSDFILYAITSVIKPNYMKDYFTTKEIGWYSTHKYSASQIHFPIEIPVLKVADDQYIGVTSAKWLMELREARLINYNAETQRALDIIVKNETVVYRPYVNEFAVSQIADSYKERTFIPNTISLNIDLDDENADYYYKDGVLVINSITAFDIFDGYHRYLGMARNYDINKDFDYPMELRITMFPVGKAKQFIWQEDHKTKMKKVDSAAFNQYDPGNMVVSRLNNDPSCNLCGKITLDDGLINAGIINQALDKIYFVDKPDKAEVIKVSKDLRIRLNNFVETYNYYLTNEWSKVEIYIVICGFKQGYSDEHIYNTIQNISPELIKLIKRRTTSSLTGTVVDMIKEVLKDG